MKTLILGIDPGESGGFALLDTVKNGYVFTQALAK